MLEASCLATIESYGLISRGEKVLVALSGGPDSVAMLHFLSHLAPFYGVDLYAAHVNHMLRGCQSDEDARFCEGFCRELGVPVVARRLDVRALCAATGLGTQEAARQGRYEILVEEAIRTGASTVAVGQNLDDQAETVLFRLARGTGPGGLGGIWPKRPFVTAGGLGPVTLVRPLLRTSRAEIMEYIERHSLEFRTDPTNLKPDYARNLVRLEVMPLLREINPSAEEAIGRLAELLREQEEFFAERVAGLVDSIEQTERGARIWAVVLTSLSRPGQRYIARRAVEIAMGDLRRVNMDHIDAALDVAAGRAEACELPGRLVVRKKYGWLTLEMRASEPVRWDPVEIGCPGRTVLTAAGRVVDAQVTSRNALLEDPHDNRDPNRAYVDLGVISLPVKARQRRDGDAFMPLGMQGTKKVKDFLISQQIPLAERDMIPIFVDACDSILWLGGLRIDERFRVTNTTGEVLVLKLENAC